MRQETYTILHLCDEVPWVSAASICLRRSDRYGFRLGSGEELVAEEVDSCEDDPEREDDDVGGRHDRRRCRRQAGERERGEGEREGQGEKAEPEEVVKARGMGEKQARIYLESALAPYQASQAMRPELGRLSHHVYVRHSIQTACVSLRTSAASPLRPSYQPRSQTMLKQPPTAPEKGRCSKRLSIL